MLLTQLRRCLSGLLRPVTRLEYKLLGGRTWPCFWAVTTGIANRVGSRVLCAVPSDPGHLRESSPCPVLWAALLFPFLRGGNWGSGRLHSLPRDMPSKWQHWDSDPEHELLNVDMPSFSRCEWKLWRVHLSITSSWHFSWTCLKVWERSSTFIEKWSQVSKWQFLFE